VGICVWIFTTIDSWLGDSLERWLGFRVWGGGFLITMALITLIGFMASGILTRGALAAVEAVFERLPGVRLLYHSAKDLLNAFVGERRRFDKPVLVALDDEATTQLVGFLTAESLDALGAADHVTVYIPFSYSIAGHVMVVPARRVRRVDADAPAVMAYIVSGGVTRVGG
jgi:uncharacterized membrane protein